jgi:hypothetical protein
MMFDFLYRKWREPDSKLTENDLIIAVNNGWITEKDMIKIKGN